MPIRSALQRAVTRTAVALAVLTTVVRTAHAQSATLTFEGLADNTQVGSFYAGGAGGSYGITFDSTAYASLASTAGGFGNFQAAPSGTTALYFTAPSTATVNVAGGFNSFALWYAGIYDPGTVSVYSGADGTGTLLGTTTLGVTSSAAGTTACPAATASYCPFTFASVLFSGTARSVVFGGAANEIVFDDLTFGGVTGTAVTPEPATVALVLVGLSGVAAARRRRPHA